MKLNTKCLGPLKEGFLSKRFYLSLYLRNLFRLPGPMELGWNDCNALEDEEFSSEVHGKTWQDWHRTVKQMHPVKYFFAETLTLWFNKNVWWPIKNPISKFHYWLVSHLVPSRRYHWLDLRQPGEYQYGWRDVPEKMFYAMFNLLGEYLEKENPHDLTAWYSREEIDQDEALKAQQDALDEARALYHWWRVERLEEDKKESEALSSWHEAHKQKSPQAKELWNDLQKIKAENIEKPDQMAIRLLKIRHTLWT